MGKSVAELRREKLRSRQKQAVETRDQKGLGKKSIMDWGKLSKKPQLFTIEAKKKYTIDILPFKITQDWYKKLRTPAGLTTGLDIGEWDYKLEIPVHKNIGENNDTFICLREAFGGKCCICDDMFAEYAKEKQDDKVIQSCKPSWRDYMNIYDYDDPDADIQALDDASFFFWDKEFLEESEEGEEIILYTDIEEGKSLVFKGKEKTIGNGKPFTIPGKVSFIDREGYEESIVDETISFDALIQIPTYDEVYQAHNAKSEVKDEENNTDSEPEEEPKTRGRSRTKKEEPKNDPKNNPKEEKSDNKCPEDRNFGYDCDPNHDDCNNCPEASFNECADLKEDIDNGNVSSDPDPEDNEMQIDEKREEKQKIQSRSRSRRESVQKNEPKEKQRQAPTRRRTRR